MVETYSVQTEIGRSGGPRRSAEGEEDEERTSKRDRETKERLAIVTSSVDEGVSACLLRVTQGSR